MGDCVYPGKSFREDPSSPPGNPIPFRPLISHPPTGTDGTTPCGVGNAQRPEPGVVRRPAQPRAVWHNVVDVGGGEMMRAMTHYVHGNAAGRGRSPLPLRESPRPCLAPSPSGNPNGIVTAGDGRGPIPPSGNAGGRAIAVPPSGNPKVTPYPIPLGESQRDSAMKPGVAPPRRYPGSTPTI